MIKSLNKDLATKAHRLGICDEWRDELLTLDDKQSMCQMYLRGIDFCLSNDFPTNEYIQEHFGDVATQHGIFVDKEITVHNRQKCVCLGTTHGSIILQSYAISEIFCKHDANIEIVANNKTFAMVDVFDNSRVNVIANDDAKVCINHYGGVVKYIKNGNAVVKIKEKGKKTY